MMKEMKNGITKKKIKYKTSNYKYPRKKRKK